MSDAEREQERIEQLRTQLLKLCDASMLPVEQIAGAFGFVAGALVAESYESGSPALVLAFEESRACFVEGMHEMPMRLHYYMH